jgi:hypothetical protein
MDRSDYDVFVMVRFRDLRAAAIEIDRAAAREASRKITSVAAKFISVA